MDNEIQPRPHANLAAALAKAQAVMGGAKKDALNPHLKSKYADLASVWEACREPLTRHELSIVQFPEANGSTVTVRTMLLHSSGEFLETSISATAKDASPQAIGSVLTYLRRYSLAAMVGIAPEDDDGEAAQHRPTTQAAPPARPQVLKSDPKPDPIEVSANEKASKPQIDKISIEMNRVFGDFMKDDFLKEAARAHLKEHTGKDSRTQLTKADASNYLDVLTGMPNYTPASA